MLSPSLNFAYLIHQQEDRFISNAAKRWLYSMIINIISILYKDCHQLLLLRIDARIPYRFYFAILEYCIFATLKIIFLSQFQNLFLT
ncbi:ABC transporter G family member [Dirofilaria immitis]